MSELGQVLAAMMTQWGGDKSGEAIQSALTRLVELASLVKQKVGDVGAAPAMPGAKDKEGKANDGAKAAEVAKVADAKANDEKPNKDDTAAAADAAAPIVVVPVVAPLPVAPAPQPKIVPAVPGPEKVGLNDTEAVPVADAPDTRRVVGFGLAIGLASLGGIYLVEQSRPAARKRAREPWEDELPRADKP
jgi:hypothetical protein